MGRIFSRRPLSFVGAIIVGIWSQADPGTGFAREACLIISSDDSPDFPPKAVAAVAGAAATGQAMSLDGRGSEGPYLRYRWIQTGGPPVEMHGADGPVCRFTVPSAPGALKFILAVSNSAGIATDGVEIPDLGDAEASMAAGEGLQSDAGDDQAARVGQQITLNGVRSRPRHGVAYRWIQVEGPEIPLKLEEGPIYTFVAPAPGAYRFALVIASGGRISLPSFVRVTVAASPPGPTPAARASRTLRQIAADGLLSVEGGPASADRLASAFESVAGQMNLYSTVADIFNEISLRLDAVLPPDAARRAHWSEQVFVPLSAGMVEILRPTGLDLARPDCRTSPIVPQQRDALADGCRQIAAGFHDVRMPR